jgi:hypothetical protein
MVEGRCYKEFAMKVSIPKVGQIKYRLDFPGVIEHARLSGERSSAPSMQTTLGPRQAAREPPRQCRMPDESGSELSSDPPLVYL